MSLILVKLCRFCTCVNIFWYCYFLLIVYEQASYKNLQQVQEQLDNVTEELNLAKDINSSQEETIKQLQAQFSDSTG